MGAAGWLIRARLRSRWGACAMVALVTALGATGTLVAAGAADRTTHAYSRYLDRAGVSDVVINPSLVSRDIDRAIRTLPGVEAVTSSSLFLTGEGGPRSRAASKVDLSAALVVGSTDGRYTDMDRPVLVEGRMPTGNDEVLVNAELARVLQLKVGDHFPLAFTSRLADLTGSPDDVPDPIGIEQLRIVGIGTLSDEVLPDGVYPRYRIIVSPDVARRYDCLPASPARDASLEEATAILAPADCALSYKYYSLKIGGGDRGVTRALAAFAKRSLALTAALPQALRDQVVGYTLVAKTTTREDQQRVDRSLSPTVAALLVLAIAAGLVTLTILGLVVARELNRVRRDQIDWWRLGMTTYERTRVVVAPMLLAVTSGLIVSVLLAWVFSPVAPIGTVRVIDPSPTREVSSWVWIGAVALTAAAAVLLVLLSFRSSRRMAPRPSPAPRSPARRVLRGSNRPEIDDGVRAAYSTNRGAGLVFALACLAVMVFLASAVFGTSLSRLTSTPAAYGWPWNVAVMGNLGYGGFDREVVADTLDRRDDIRSWTALGFSNSVLLDDDALPAVFALDRHTTDNVTVVSGRLPSASDEVAVAAHTAADHDLQPGDEVRLSGYEVAARHATVTGIVVLPALGPFQADRASPGRGLLLPEAMLKNKLRAGAVSFVGIDVDPDARPGTTLAAVRRQSASWFGDDAESTTTIVYPDPVRPAEIVNARSVRIAPLLVGGLLIVTATLGLAVAIVMSVRARRREMAVLRALGFTSRQLRISVRVQTLATMVGAFVIGAPVGIALGRLAWQSFASALGVVPDPSAPVAWIAATGVGAALIALLAAAGPARLAARTNPAVSLRSE